MLVLYLSCFCKSAIGCAICTKQGSSGYCSHPCSLHRGFPPGHRLYIAFHIVQLRLYYVVSCQSFARYIMKLHFHINHISRRDCRFRTIVYLSLPENHNQNNCDSFIASIRYHFWLTELPPKFDNLDYIKSRS